MISQITGRLISREIDRIEIMTAGGVAYELQIPLSVYESLPAAGKDVSLHTYLVVKEDGWHLFGFENVFERKLFQRLLSANGVGPALALGMMSALSARRLVRAIQEKDIPTLQGVPRVGRKKAERIILDLGEKLDDLAMSDGQKASRPGGAAADDAMRALMSLGYSLGESEKAVRAALDGGAKPSEPAEVIRAALSKIGS